LAKNNNLFIEVQSICDLLESAGDDSEYLVSLIKEPGDNMGSQGSLKEYSSVERFGPSNF
jgi:hypothetical protein